MEYYAVQEDPTVILCLCVPVRLFCFCVSLLSPTVAPLLFVVLGRPMAASTYLVEVLLPQCAGR